jgi:hypothetical protein
LALTFFLYTLVTLLISRSISNSPFNDYSIIPLPATLYP